MSRILEATCAAGVVKVGTLEIPDVNVLSEGVAQSSGILVVQDDAGHYLPKGSDDLKTTIGKLSDALADVVAALNAVGTALTAIAAVPSGWVTPPASVAANVSTITTKTADLTALKSALDTLKGNLK